VGRHTKEGAGALAPTPGWVDDALSVYPEERWHTVSGAAIRALMWGERGRPLLVLVHGGAAHAHWWDWIAPRFLPSFRVVALELSGHGFSGRRECYSFPLWAREVAEVAAAEADDDPCAIVGHSMGGVVAAMLAGGPPALGVVLIDAPLHAPVEEHVDDAEAVFSRVKRYPSEAEARDRFRLLPEQPVLQPRLIEHVAMHSVGPAPDGADGWSWRFDPAVFATSAADRPADIGDLLAAPGVRFGAVVGERSPVVPAEDRDRLKALAAGRPDSSYVEVPGGFHHLMFDRPLELIDAVSGTVARWGLPVEGATDPRSDG
jgi:pimeloyl-ACP methyl ester carboxylesterase